mmetsp:Transcript_3027/g.5112  ORF Transcript_3027/g.5112 Transcript_3027/m.5112 type:complete len:97 (+) Transcript_3027:660-950(+)
MPSLPSSIKGSIGTVSGPGQIPPINSTQNIGSKRQAHNGIPLNIAANDITFSNNYGNMRKYGAQSQVGVNGQSLTGSQNQKLMQLNLNNQGGAQQA